MNFQIMLVDDEPNSLGRLERLFAGDYQVAAACSSDEALWRLEQHDVALLITRQRTPSVTGIELLTRTASMRPHMVRIVLTDHADLKAMIDADHCGEVYRCVTGPWDEEDLRLTVARAVRQYTTNRARHEAEESNKRLARSLRETTQGVIRVIADTMEAKDRHVYGHARRVSGYALAVGRRMRLGVELLEQISLAALMHDVGKIGTPDAILLKPAALTDEEHAVVRLHAERGARMLAEIPGMGEAAAAVRHHHEDFDGRGYPEGIAGERIPVASRIIRVADAYDAMTSPRPFRAALDHEAAVAELSRGAGTQFDPEVVRAFCGLEALAKIRGSIKRGDFGFAFLPVNASAALWRLPPEGLVRVIETEPALAARVLRAANAGWASGETTASLYAACGHLGEESLREIISQSDAGRERGPGAEALRDHSLRCAAAAQLLAEMTGALDPGEAYTAGLLHDLGEALLCSLFPEEAEKIIWLGHPLRLDREIAAFGVDHAQVGQWILDACHAPPALARAVQMHHDINLAGDPAALLLHVADAVARAHDSSEMASLDSLPAHRLAMLRLSRADLARAHELTGLTVCGRLDRAAA
ncbi:MAG TPA: HD domain-containing phosphohydrolase [Pyrinomonadaceae bacterium]